MSSEAAREYAKQYRRDGYGKNADARYRERHLRKIREIDRLRKQRQRDKARRDGGLKV